jgi:SAM-dependent methyltransferase
MEAHYEDKYYSMEEKNWWFKARRDLITAYLKKTKVRKILDIGCGAGGTLEHLRSNGFYEACGIDISKNALQRCKQKKLCVFPMSADNMRFKNNSFDALIAADILEHMLDDDKTLSEWHRVLRPGGYLILFVPAFMHLWSKHDTLNHHTKRYTLPELVNRCKNKRFSVIKSTYWNFMLYPARLILTQLTGAFNSEAMNFPDVPAVINQPLHFMLGIENSLILKGGRFPFGISCFAVLQKQNEPISKH